ncbi:MAG: hypothetical protein ACRD0J_13730 [Acidimicrobiales bacterium]
MDEAMEMPKGLKSLLGRVLAGSGISPERALALAKAEGEPPAPVEAEMAGALRAGWKVAEAVSSGRTDW